MVFYLWFNPCYHSDTSVYIASRPNGCYNKRKIISSPAPQLNVLQWMKDYVSASCHIIHNWLSGRYRVESRQQSVPQVEIRKKLCSVVFYLHPGLARYSRILLIRDAECGTFRKSKPDRERIILFKISKDRGNTRPNTDDTSMILPPDVRIGYSSFLIIHTLSSSEIRR